MFLSEKLKLSFYSCCPAIVINTSPFNTHYFLVLKENQMILPFTEPLLHAKVWTKIYDSEIHWTNAPVYLNVDERKGVFFHFNPRFIQHSYLYGTQQSIDTTLSKILQSYKTEIL